MEYSGTTLAFTGRNQMRTNLSALIREREKEPLEYERRTQVVRRLKRMVKGRTQSREPGLARRRA